MTFYAGYGTYYGRDDPTPDDLQRLAEAGRAYEQAYALEFARRRIGIPFGSSEQTCPFPGARPIAHAEEQIAHQTFLASERH